MFKFGDYVKVIGNHDATKASSHVGAMLRNQKFYVYKVEDIRLDNKVILTLSNTTDPTKVKCIHRLYDYEVKLYKEKIPSWM